MPELTVNCIMEAIMLAINHELPRELAEPLAHVLVYRATHGTWASRVQACLAARRNYPTLLRIIKSSEPRSPRLLGICPFILVLMGTLPSGPSACLPARPPVL